MHCERFHEQLGPYLDEELHEAERSAWRQHLSECSECRQWAVSQEPALLFAAIPQPAADQQQVDRCALAVTALIHQDRLSRRLQRPSRAPWLAAAAVLLLMVALSLLWWDGDRTPQGHGTETVVAEDAAGTATAPEVVVDMEGEGISTYYFTADDDTAVAFVVNPALEL